MTTRITILLAATLALAGCAKDPVSTDQTNNNQFQVGLLFDVDGCTVYRFEDAGRYHYFTNCAGTVMEQQSHQCGKTRCSHDEEIPTYRSQP
jgi:hypothetical protein